MTSGGPFLLGRGPCPAGRGPIHVGRGPLLMGRGPFLVGGGPGHTSAGPFSVGRGPLPMGRGPVLASRGPLPNVTGPVLVDPGPRLMTKGPLPIDKGRVRSKEGPALLDRRRASTSERRGRRGGLSETLGSRRLSGRHVPSFRESRRAEVDRSGISPLQSPLSGQGAISFRGSAAILRQLAPALHSTARAPLALKRRSLRASPAPCRDDPAGPHRPYRGSRGPAPHRDTRLSLAPSRARCGSARAAFHRGSRFAGSPGGFPPRAPTDPDVRMSRIRLVRSQVCSRRRCGSAVASAAGNVRGAARSAATRSAGGSAAPTIDPRDAWQRSGIARGRLRCP